MLRHTIVWSGPQRQCVYLYHMGKSYRQVSLIGELDPIDDKAASLVDIASGGKKPEINYSHTQKRYRIWHDLCLMFP